MNYSSALALAWSVAANEAMVTSHEFIEPEHFFIALCKTHLFLSKDILDKLEISIPAKQLLEELEPVHKVLSARRLDPEALRRRVRALKGRSGYQRKEGERTHRSAACREAFGKAEAAASAAGAAAVLPVHL